MHVYRTRGQSSVELVAVVGLLAVVATVAIQIVLAASSVMDAAGAARVGARAASIGLSGQNTARRALPTSFQRRAMIEHRRRSGGELVSVAIPIAIQVPGTSVDDLTVRIEAGR